MIVPLTSGASVEAGDTHSMSRPELVGPAELYYNDSRAAQYTSNTRVMNIQAAMTERAVELLNFAPGESKLVLDCECALLRLASMLAARPSRHVTSHCLSCVAVGCGSGLSGDVLSEAGHEWVGIDIRCVTVTSGAALRCDVSRRLLFAAPR
jgi:18S rRNA (guanine1575-N7)-methyltransferase